MLAWCLITAQVVWYDTSVFGHFLVLQRLECSQLQVLLLHDLTKHVAHLQATEQGAALLSGVAVCAE